MLGPHRNEARGRLPAYPRIHLFVRRGLSEGRHLRLSDHADIEYSMLPGLPQRSLPQDILLVLDGAPNHRCGDLALPDNISLLFLPPYSPELNPEENLWDEIRKKIFKNYALNPSTPSAPSSSRRSSISNAMPKSYNQLDAALIARAQVIEHFEIACYGTLISWAELLGYDQAVALLEESLEEEESLDETLTEMAEGKSNLEADKEETKPRKTRAASRQ
jgi:uncharacterized protein DUF892/DDE superfamily endonuclease